MIRESDLLVRSYHEPKDDPHSIKMEVGIEDCLHIEFEYNKSTQVDKENHMHLASCSNASFL